MKIPKKFIKTAEKSLNLLAKIAPVKVKRMRELYYWKIQRNNEQNLSSRHYLNFYTKEFNLDEDFYNGKKILDIGCGPRGSLEWANMASERVGLDPLADEYLKLGAKNHKMTYICAPAEEIPHDDNYFDVVTSFNSIDHVDDLDLTIKQIKRILKPSGIFLLLTELNHEATVTEPITFSWDIVEKFKPEFEILEEKHYEKQEGIYVSIRENIAFDHENPRKRPGVLSAKFRKI